MLLSVSCQSQVDPFIGVRMLGGHKFSGRSRDYGCVMTSWKDSLPGVFLLLFVAELVSRATLLSYMLTFAKISHML